MENPFFSESNWKKERVWQASKCGEDVRKIKLKFRKKSSFTS